MQNKPIVKNGRVARAESRLESAIAQLERAVSNRASRDIASVPSAEMDALRGQNDQLRRVNADATHRLDNAIGRLGLALAGEVPHDVAAE